MPRPSPIALSTFAALASLAAGIGGLMVLITRWNAPPAAATGPTAPVAAASAPTAGAAPASYTPPDMTTIPSGPLGDAIRRGRQIVEHTFEELPTHVGNDLHCTSCHLEGGTKAGAAPWVGLPAVFPEFRARSGRVDTLDRRVNDCFERSLNGSALEPGSPDMTAILAYMSFISRGVPAGQTPGRGFRRIEHPPVPDPELGARLYTEQCAACHGEDGSGRRNGDQYMFPPLFGEHSFNLGAGMARLDTAAAFIRWNMPLGRAGTLSDTEAYAIADYFIHRDRPDWAGRDRDWPNGGKPRDARY